MFKSVTKAARVVKIVDSQLPRYSTVQFSMYASTESSTSDHCSTSAEHTHEEIRSQGGEKEKKKTMAEQDEELRLKLEGISGEGGELGLELEDGQPVAMKRGVRENMFRLI